MFLARTRAAVIYHYFILTQYRVWYELILFKVASACWNSIVSESAEELAVNTHFDTYSPWVMSVFLLIAVNKLRRPFYEVSLFLESHFFILGWINIYGALKSVLSIKWNSFFVSTTLLSPDTLLSYLWLLVCALWKAFLFSLARLCFVFFSFVNKVQFLVSICTLDSALKQSTTKWDG